MNAQRTLSIVAAIMLVAAFLLATIGPSPTILSDLLATLSPELVAKTAQWLTAADAEWVWRRVLLPVLQRPAWLVPASISLLAAGGAATLAMGDGQRRPRRKK